MCFGHYFIIVQEFSPKLLNTTIHNFPNKHLFLIIIISTIQSFLNNTFIIIIPRSLIVSTNNLIPHHY